MVLSNTRQRVFRLNDENGRFVVHAADVGFFLYPFAFAVVEILADEDVIDIPDFSLLVIGVEGEPTVFAIDDHVAVLVKIVDRAVDAIVGWVNVRMRYGRVCDRVRAVVTLMRQSVPVAVIVEHLPPRLVVIARLLSFGKAIKRIVYIRLYKRLSQSAEAQRLSGNVSGVLARIYITAPVDLAVLIAKLPHITRIRAMPDREFLIRSRVLELLRFF